MTSTKSITNKVSNDKKFVILFVFLYEIHFIFAHFNVNVIKESYITKNSLQKFLLNITNKSCYKGLKYCKFIQKINKTKHIILMKKDHSKR